MMESSDKIWSTGEGNVKPLYYSCLENCMNSIKMLLYIILDILFLDLREFPE